MSCNYKNECPSYSGWCEGPKQNFAMCVQFLVGAYEREKARRYRRRFRRNPNISFMLSRLEETM